MDYVEAIARLNGMQKDELETEFKSAEGERDGSTDILKRIVGSVFSASKEIKVEELYRVVINGEKPIEDYGSFWEADGGYVTLCSDPITPFLDNEIKEGSVATLITYRKAVYKNPLGLMLEGFPENSSVFNILEKDGLSENGKKNYLAICSFIRKGLENCKPGCAFIENVKSALEDGAPSDAYCYSISGAEYCAFKPDYAKIYYRPTSSILCRLVSANEDEVKIEPLMHNSSAISDGAEIEYDDFGEVGNFTFEMADYR